MKANIAGEERAIRVKSGVGEFGTMQPPDMTPPKDETPEEFRARQRARYAAAIRSIGKGGWHGRGNGNGTSCFWF